MKSEVVEMSNTYQAKLMHVEELLPTIFRLKLQIEEIVHFKAGQYLNVIMSEHDKRPFSIASVMAESDDKHTLIELHIGGVELNEYGAEVINKALTKGFLDIEMPRGDSWLRLDSQRPILLIAGGTGYSYIRPLLLEALANPVSINGTIRPIYFYWGVNQAPFLYDCDAVTKLAQNFNELKFRPVIVNPDNNWAGHQGMVLDAVEADFDDLSNFDIYLAGRVELAKLARDRLVSLRSAQLERLFSDTYAYI